MALCTAMPPPTLIASELQSTLAKSAWWAIALNSVLTAGKLWKRCCDSSFSMPGMSRGLAIRMLQPPMRMPSIMFVLKPKM